MARISGVFLIFVGVLCGYGAVIGYYSYLLGQRMDDGAVGANIILLIIAVVLILWGVKLQRDLTTLGVWIVIFGLSFFGLFITSRMQALEKSGREAAFLLRWSQYTVATGIVFLIIGIGLIVYQRSLNKKDSNS